MRLWRALYWAAILAILVEALGLAATFRETRARRADNAAELAPDQIAAVARLWPRLSAAERPDVLKALSGQGLVYKTVAEPPPAQADEARVPLVEQAVDRRLDGAQAIARIAAKRPRLWALSSAPLRVFVRLDDGEWLEAEARGELGARFFGLPAGFWVGVIGLWLAAGVLWAILREGRAVARISHALEAFAATGAPQPLRPAGSPEVAALARRATAMQAQVAALIEERAVMLGAIAHDIKTYVQRLTLRLDLLDDPTQAEKARRDLDAMTRFVDDALLLASHARPLIRADDFDLAELVAHEAEAARLGGGDVGFAREGSGPWRMRGDPTGVARALANIVGNALRYGSAARIALRRRGPWFEIVVDDSGPGVPPAEREAAFAPFRRGEASRSRETGGAGLGLAVARGIAEQHGGGIVIADAPGGGARLVVTLPAV